jgi:hypothetical protein
LGDKHKKPKFGANPNPQKVVPRVRAPAAGPPWSWSFVRTDKNGPFAWTRIEADQALELMHKLAEFEHMNFSQLASQGSHGIQTTKLDKVARERLTAIKQDDLDLVVSFRISGKCRLFCVAEGMVMFVLWWDPDHAVCPSVLKNT